MGESASLFSLSCFPCFAACKKLKHRRGKPPHGRPDQTCGEINVDVANSTKSYHRKILRDSGVIRMCGDGKQRFVSLRREGLDKRFPGLCRELCYDFILAKRIL